MEDEAPSVESLVDAGDFNQFVPQIASSAISKETEPVVVFNITDSEAQASCSSADLFNAVKSEFLSN